MRSKTIFAVMAAAATAFALMSFAGDARAQMLSLIPTYGNGKVQVRLYTDYFCSPCRAMEPKIAPVLSKLVRDNVISLTFADVPLRPASSMYADYFLRAAGAGRDINNALKIRATLDEAAARGIKTPDELERHLSNKKITCAKLDNRPTLKALETRIRSDRIMTTPTCVIEVNGVRRQYNSPAAIITALSQLKN